MAITPWDMANLPDYWTDDVRKEWWGPAAPMRDQVIAAWEANGKQGIHPDQAAAEAAQNHRNLFSQDYSDFSNPMAVLHDITEYIGETGGSWAKGAISPQDIAVAGERMNEAWKKSQRQGPLGGFHDPFGIMETEAIKLDNMIEKHKAQPETLVLDTHGPISAEIVKNLTGRDYDADVNLTGGLTKRDEQAAREKGVDPTADVGLHRFAAAATLAGLAAAGGGANTPGGGDGVELNAVSPGDASIGDPSYFDAGNTSYFSNASPATSSAGTVGSGTLATAGTGASTGASALSQTGSTGGTTGSTTTMSGDYTGDLPIAGDTSGTSIYNDGGGGGGDTGSGLDWKTIAQYAEKYGPQVANKLIELAKRAGPAALGAIGANQQADAMAKLAEKYMAMGAPSRDRYEASFAPGFTMENDPGFTDAMNAASKANLHALSVTHGNPALVPNAQAQNMKDLYDRVALPAIQNYRNQNAATGGIASFSAAAPGAAGGAIDARGNMFDAIGAGANDIFNPKPSQLEILKALRGGV